MKDEVGVLPMGQRYHDPAKHFLRGYVVVDRSAAEVEGYRPCAYCFPPDQPVRPAIVGDPSASFMRLYRLGQQ